MTRAPVIVLAGTELFASHGVRLAWEEKGGKHARLVSRVHMQLESLRTLANLTQHLYLGMPSFGEWIQNKWEVRHARAKAKMPTKP